jgi:hypothetical protein
MTRCCLQLECECADTCAAYLADQLPPGCIFVHAAHSLSQYLESLKREGTTMVKYPAGPPAPEVR